MHSGSKNEILAFRQDDFVNGNIAKNRWQFVAALRLLVVKLEFYIDFDTDFKYLDVTLNTSIVW